MRKLADRWNRFTERGDDESMDMFEAKLRPSGLWKAVLLPPTVFWCLVQHFSWEAGQGVMEVERVVTLIALANLIPLGALAWVLCSVAAYTVEPERLIVHRVIGDRAIRFGRRMEVTPLAGGTIALRVAERTLRLRVDEPERCLASLRRVESAVRAR